MSSASGRAGAEGAGVERALEGGAASSEWKAKLGSLRRGRALGGAGVDVVSGGRCRVSIVQVRVAGVGSTLPAASVARTEKVWVPSARSV